MDWKLQAMSRVEEGMNIHPVERIELTEQGLICYTDSPKELVLTELGRNILTRAESPDHASKRY